MSYGAVVSTKTNWRGYGKRHLISYLNNGGYPCVSLTISGVEKQYRIHRLLAMRFFRKPKQNQTEVRHLDGNKQNNRLLNLKWGTSKENALDRIKHGRCSMAVNNQRHCWKRSGSGIGARKDGTGWRSQISIYGESVYLGHFKTKHEAMAIYKEVSRKYRKERERYL